MVIETEIRLPPAATADGSGNDATDEWALSVDVAMRRHANTVPAGTGFVGHGEEEQVAASFLAVGRRAVAVGVAKLHRDFWSEKQLNVN